MLEHDVIGDSVQQPATSVYDEVVEDLDLSAVSTQAVPDSVHTPSEASNSADEDFDAKYSSILLSTVDECVANLHATATAAPSVEVNGK